MSSRLGPSDMLTQRARENHDAQGVDTASIYRSSSTDTRDFGSNVTWAALDDVSASYWTVTGREAYALQQLQVIASVAVSMPVLTDITEKDEIVYTVFETGKIHHFKVSMVNEKTPGQSLIVYCTEYKFEN